VTTVDAAGTAERYLGGPPGKKAPVPWFGPQETEARDSLGWKEMVLIRLAPGRSPGLWRPPGDSAGQAGGKGRDGAEDYNTSTDTIVSLTLFGYAYETDAGVPITAGAVPIPGSILLLGSGLMGLGLLGWRRKKS
jgi:hypothetical protein